MVDAPNMTPFVTPNADFYRIDTALVAPQVRTADYTLRIHGMVDNELELSYEDLLGRDMIERDITMTCVSNEVGGRYVGNARWLGVPLADLLAEAGVQAGADQVVGRSVDGFACGFPVADAIDGRDALVVVGMNGEPLPIEHGFPVRLVVPGLYGYVSATKWLTEIELTTFAEFDHYWLRRGWAQRAPIKLMSRIDTPRGLGKVDRRHRPHRRRRLGADRRDRRRRGAHRRRRVATGAARRGHDEGHVAPVGAAVGGDGRAAHHHRAGDRRGRRNPDRGACRTYPRRRFRTPQHRGHRPVTSRIRPVNPRKDPHHEDPTLPRSYGRPGRDRIPHPRRRRLRW